MSNIKQINLHSNMDLVNIQTMDVKTDHEYLWLVTMGIDCVAIEVFAIVARMDFVQCAVEFDLVVVFEPKRFVAKFESKKKMISFCKIRYSREKRTFSFKFYCNLENFFLMFLLKFSSHLRSFFQYKPEVIGTVD